MRKQWYARSTAPGRAHPAVRWTLAALLALLSGWRVLWAGARTLCGWALPELGALLTSLCALAPRGGRWVFRTWRDRILPLVMTKGREVWDTSRQAAAGAVRRGTRSLRRAPFALRRHGARRAMAAVMAVCIAIGMVPVNVFGVEESCGHVHDGTCGYTEAVPQIPCDQGCGDTDGDGLVDHAPDCAYTPGTEGAPCAHQMGEHDVSCGYAAPVEGAPCTHVHDESCGYGEDPAPIQPNGEEQPPAQPEEGPVVLTALAGAPEEPLTAVEGQLDSLALPAALIGWTGEGAAPVEVPVEWTGLPDPAKKGEYVLSAVLDLPQGCELAQGVEVPALSLTLTPDPEVEAVRTLLAALPQPGQVLEAMAGEDFGPVETMAEAVQQAMDGYDALTGEQQALLPGAQEDLNALMAAFRGDAAAMAVPSAGRNWSDVASTAQEGTDYKVDGQVVHIYTALGLAYLAQCVNNEGYLADLRLNNKCVVKLENDIDLLGDQGVYWTPIGNYNGAPKPGDAGVLGTTGNPCYIGEFDGQGHTISNMNVSRNSDTTDSKGNIDYVKTAAGLFGTYDTNESNTVVTIKDLTLTGSSVVCAPSSDTSGQDNYAYAGGLIGYVKKSLDSVVGGSLVLENVSVRLSGDVKTAPGTYYYAENFAYGGLVGYVDNNAARLTVRNCAVEINGSVGDSKSNYSGGLVGRSANHPVTLENSYASVGTITAASRLSSGLPSPHAGGLMGYLSMNQCTVQNCYASFDSISAGVGGQPGGLLGYLMPLQQNASGAQVLANSYWRGDGLTITGNQGNEPVYAQVSGCGPYTDAAVLTAALNSGTYNHTDWRTWEQSSSIEVPATFGDGFGRPHEHSGLHYNTPLTADTTQLQPNVGYYLAGDVTLNDQLTFSDTSGSYYICLGGHTLDLGEYGLDVGSSIDLTILSDTGTTGTVGRTVDSTSAKSSYQVARNETGYRAAICMARNGTLTLENTRVICTAPDNDVAGVFAICRPFTTSPSTNQSQLYIGGTGNIGTSGGSQITAGIYIGTVPEAYGLYAMPVYGYSQADGEKRYYSNKALANGDPSDPVEIYFYGSPANTSIVTEMTSGQFTLMETQYVQGSEQTNAVNTEKVDLKAVAVKSTWTVTLYGEDNKQLQTVEVTKGGTFSTPSGITNANLGYNISWYTDPGRTVQWTTSDKVAGDMSLYMTRVPQQYTLTFNANGGTLPDGTAAAIQLTFGKPYGTLPTPTRTGYTFQSWQYGGQDVNENTLAVYGMMGSLTAKWKASTYTVTFDLNGEAGASLGTASMEVTYDQPYGTLPTPTGGTRKFAGWFTEADGGGQVTDADTVTNAKDHTLYAHWEDKAGIQLDLTAQTAAYNGAAQEFVLKGTHSGKGGFTVAYAKGGSSVDKPTDAGTYTVTITRPADGEFQAYTGTSTLTIDPLEFDKSNTSRFKVGGIASSILYTGKPITQNVTVGFYPQGQSWAQDLKQGTDYDLKYENNTNAGTATVTFTFKGNFTGTHTEAFKISSRPYNASIFQIGAIEDQTYTGQPVTPVPGIRCSSAFAGIDMDLTNGTDFSCTYENNTDIGTATVNIMFTGNFSGTASTTFEIVSAGLPDDITNDDVFAISGTELMKWHDEDITLVTQDGWTVGWTADGLGESVSLSDESTRTGDQVVPSRAELYVKDSAGSIYKTTVDYRLDKTLPLVVVDGMGEDGVNKIWDDEKEITIHVTDALSGVRYIQILGQSAGNTSVEYGDPSLGLGYLPIPADGTITYTVKANDIYTITAYDNADNQASWDGELPTFVVEKIDREKPTAAFGSITGAEGENGWFTGAVTVNVVVEDPETTPDDKNTIAINESNRSGIDFWEYSLDGGTNWTTGTGTSFTVAADGDYTDKLKLRATDNAGNLSETAAGSVKLDQAAPAAPALSATAGEQSYASGTWTAQNVVITLSGGNGTASGLGRYQVKIEDGEWQDVDGYTLTHSTNTPDSGVTYRFRAVNGAGREGAESGGFLVMRRSLEESVTDSADNKYVGSDLTIAPAPNENGWYKDNVTVTVAKKTGIVSGTERYPADTYYQLDGGGTVELEGTEIPVSGDGAHRLTIWTQDASGNRTTPLEAAVRIDTTAPAITGVAGNPTAWTKDDTEITFAAGDQPSGVASVRVDCDDGQTVTHTGSGFTADRNGTYTITVTDNAGNTAAQTVVVDRIDKSAPKAPAVTGYDPDRWAREDITFQLSTSDTPDTVPSGTRFQVQVGENGQWTDLDGSGYTVSEDQDGVPYAFRVVSGAGTASEPVTFTVKLDKTVPQVQVDMTANGAPYTGQWTAHNVVLTPSNTAGNISGVTFCYQKQGDGDWTTITGGSVTVNYNGETTLLFKAVSGAGVESMVVSQTVKRSAMTGEELAETRYGEEDVTISPEPKDGWYSALPAVTVTPKDTVGVDGLPAATWYELYKKPAGSGTPKKLEAPWKITPDSDGIWTLKLWTEDAAGNSTEPYVITLMVDTTAPSITDVAGNPAAWQKTDAAITFAAGDAISGVAAVTVTRGEEETISSAYGEGRGSFSADRNGAYNIMVTDHAGNTATQTVEVTRIDKTAPTVTWTPDTAALSPDKWYGKTAITAQGTDDSGEGPSIALTASGKSYENGQIVDQTGSYTFYATATDGAGNVGRSTPLTVRIETAIDDFAAKVGALDSSSGYQDILDVVNWHNSQSTTVKDRFSKSDEAAAAYERLMDLLQDRVQEAADGVAEDIRNAGTIEEIEQAAKDYDALPDEARDRVPDQVKAELEKKRGDAEEARKVVEQLENADRDKSEKDPGGSYEEKQGALESYDRLTEDQKKLVDQAASAVEDKAGVDRDVAAIDKVLDLLEAIQRPYAPASKEQIKKAGETYDALTQKQKDVFPQGDKDRLDRLEEMRQHAQEVEDQIEALGNSPEQAALISAKGAYDALTADEKAMVDGRWKADLDQKYQDMLDKLTADEKAAAEFTAKVEETKREPTVDRIEELIQDYGALTDGAREKLTDQTRRDYEALVGDLEAASDVIGKLDGIDVDALAPEDMEKVEEALGVYGELTEDQKKLVDEAAGGKPGILQEAVNTVKDAVDQIGDIPDHGEGSTRPGPDGGTVPDLDKCGDNTPSHTYETHRQAIEEAKIAYERLTDAGRRLISEAARDRLNREYAALMAYLEYINTASTATTQVEVAGLAEKVELPGESASAPKTVISVVLSDSRPEAMPPVPAGKSEAMSVDLKLMASIYDTLEGGEPTSTEPVQPKRGERVLVKLKVPSGYRNDTLEIWHVRDNGGRSRIGSFWLVTEEDGIYAVFEVSSFSHFVFFAERISTGGGGGGSGSSPSKVEVAGSGNGSVTVTPSRPGTGAAVTIRPRPDEGYVVDKVVVTGQNGTDIPVKDNGDGTWSYTQPSGRVIVTVTFRPDSREEGFPFADVGRGDWFYESVKRVYEMGLMSGTAGDRFSPYLDTSRGMIVTILWRLAGAPEEGGAAPFADVAPNAYYGQAVAWGARYGIVAGYDNGGFGPDDPITREQLAAILYRYAQYQGIDTLTRGDLSAFADQPSAWAREAVQWAVGAGIITGKGGGLLDPAGRAARGETAVMLTKYLELLDGRS